MEGESSYIPVNTVNSNAKYFNFWKDFPSRTMAQLKIQKFTCALHMLVP